MARRLLLCVVLLPIVLLFVSCASSPSPAPAAPAPAATSAPPAAAPAEVAPSPAAPSAEPVAAPADDSETATVYIYRPKSFLGMALHPTVMLDGQDLINVANGTVWSGRFKAGHYVFQMDDKKSGAELDLKAGDTYYMKVEIVPGFWKGGGKMTLMAKEQGSLEIKQLRPLPPNEVEHAAFKQP